MDTAPTLRRAEVLAALSLATDLGTGQPLEQQWHACIAALRLGRELGLDESQLGTTYNLALLRSLGCTAHAYELGAWFDDELAAQESAAVFSLPHSASPRADLARHAGMGRPLLRRLLAITAALAGGPSFRRVLRASTDAAQRLADELGLEATVQVGLACIFERWDGKGPRGLIADEVPLPVRIVQVASDAQALVREHGPQHTRALLRKRAGRAYDPIVVAMFDAICPTVWEEQQHIPLLDTLLATEPGTPRRLGFDGVERTLRAIADFTDLKSPFTTGHSRAVAFLSEHAAREAGFRKAETILLRWAGLIHDVGRVGVSSGIWHSTGPLDDRQWKRVRLHPSYTARAFARVDRLASVGELAAQHHERLDGSGYPRRARSHTLPGSARILAAADVFQAALQPRAHRPALSMDQASDLLHREVTAGKLDRRAADAVIAVSARAPDAVPRTSHNLNDGDLELLQLLASGFPVRQIAQRLGISRTRASSHVQRMYATLGINSRPAAALFAMRNELFAQPA